MDIVTIRVETPLTNTNNSLEYLLVTLSRSFDLSPRQAAALLTNNNQYLITACVKGVKGGYFLPVLNWYKEMSDNILILIELLASELSKFEDIRSIQKVLSILASGLYSSSTEVVRKTLIMLKECFDLFNTA